MNNLFNTWSYNIKQIPINDNVSNILSKMGNKNWECFNVSGNTYYFKKNNPGLISRIPMFMVLGILGFNFYKSNSNSNLD